MVFTCISRVEEKYLTSGLKNEMTTQLPLFLNYSIVETNETLPVDNNDELMMVKLKIATALAFWCGVFQVKYIINNTKYK